MECLSNWMPEVCDRLLAFCGFARGPRAAWPRDALRSNVSAWRLTMGVERTSSNRRWSDLPIGRRWGCRLGIGNTRRMAFYRKAGTSAAIVLAITLLIGAQAAASGDPAEDRATADSLAAMLWAGRAVISANQVRINDPSLGPK